MKVRSRQAALLLAATVFFVAASFLFRTSVKTQARSLVWKPRQSDRWLYQIGEAKPALDLCVIPFAGTPCVSPTVWVLDLYADDGITPNRKAVRSIHQQRGRAVCYLSAGTWENWRPDAEKFPSGVLGRELSDWPGERWLDIRQVKTLEPLLRSRANACKKAGFDAIDWDNVDGFTQESGFNASADDQLAYNRMLADVAHQLDLSVGLKNDLTQVRALQPHFDFAVNEQCAKFQECDLLVPFSAAGKAVVEIEYSIGQQIVCPIANRRGWSAMTMVRELSASSWKPCR
jgi:Glycoside-hydrolase family GH114